MYFFPLHFFGLDLSEKFLDFAEEGAILAAFFAREDVVTCGIVNDLHDEQDIPDFKTVVKRLFLLLLVFVCVDDQRLLRQFVTVCGLRVDCCLR